MTTTLRSMRWATVVALIAVTAACGGGGGSGVGGDAPVPAPSPAPVPSPPAPAPALAFTGQTWSDAPAVVADNTRELPASAMAYDAVHDQLIATVVDSSGTILHGLDPVSLTTRWTLPAPAAATRIVVSDDGSTAYLALPDIGSVWQVDLANRVAVRSIQVGDRTRGEGPLSITVRPGHPGTVAVAIGRVDLDLQNFVRAAVWDDGVVRGKTTGYDGDYLEPDALAELAFVDADHLVGFDNQSTGCAFTRLALVSDGMLPILSAAPLSAGACFGDQLLTSPGRLFTSAGKEIDPENLSFVRFWPGNGAGGFFDTPTGAWLQVNSGTYTAQGGVQATRVSIEEFEAQRFTLRRDAVTDPVSRGASLVMNRMATSGSRIAFAVYDASADTIVIHALDLATINVLGHASFPVAKATGTGVTGISVAMPGVAIATDPARHRLVVALDEGIGPDGNSLAVVDPDTGAVEKLIPLSSRPANVKVSTTGSIAYVSHINARSSFDRVDLVSGTVTTLPLRADAFVIKEDDPQSVAVLDYYINYSLTAVHDMSVQGAPIDLFASTGLWQLNWIAPNGATELISTQVLSTNTGVAHFSWNSDGLTYNGNGAPIDVVNGANLRYGFGEAWDSMGVTDLTTFSRGTFPGIWLAPAVAPTSRTSAILGVESDSGPTLSWVQGSSTGGPWASTFQALISDSGLPTNVAHEMRDAAAFDSNQVAVRFAWMDELRTVEPSRIYVVKRMP